MIVWLFGGENFCTENIKLVKSFGACKVVHYTKEDFCKNR